MHYWRIAMGWGPDPVLMRELAEKWAREREEEERKRKEAEEASKTPDKEKDK